MKQNKKLAVCLVLLILNLCFIWGNSLLPADRSGALSLWLKGILHSLFPGGAIGSPATGDHLLRKLMHFGEFCSLGILLTAAFGLLGKRRWPALPAGVCAAAIDECIQIFVPGRGPGLKDVAIDSAGVLTGILLFLLFLHFFRRKKA